jgi:hypothetical protein
MTNKAVLVVKLQVPCRTLVRPWVQMTDNDSVKGPNFRPSHHKSKNAFTLGVTPDPSLITLGVTPAWSCHQDF